MVSCKYFAVVSLTTLWKTCPYVQAVWVPSSVKPALSVSSVPVLAFSLLEPPIQISEQFRHNYKFTFGDLRLTTGSVEPAGGRLFLRIVRLVIVQISQLCSNLAHGDPSAHDGNPCPLRYPSSPRGSRSRHRCVRQRSASHRTIGCASHP